MLDAAQALFVERGFEDTTIRDVATRAGVAAGTVLLHFPDKTALLAAALGEQLESALSRAWATLPNGSAREQLRHLIGALYRVHARSPALSRVLVKESMFLEGVGKEEAEARLAELSNALWVMLSRPGELREGLDADAAVRAVLAAHMACLVEGLAAPKLDVRKQLDRFDGLIEPWFAPLTSSGRRTRGPEPSRAPRRG